VPAAPRAPLLPPRPVAAAPPPPPPEPVRKLTDVDALPARPVPRLEEPEEDAPADDVLELTEDMALPTPSPPPAPPPTSGFRKIDGNSDVVFDDGPPAPLADVDREPFREVGARPLMSSNTSAAVDSAFNSLAHTVFVQNARTLEDLVREMLRPMLKSWLDDNLPSLVERLVRAEIERVSRGRG
jgi:cell pole-organizing protein PopZ